MTTISAVLAARFPQASTSPVLIEVDRLVADSLTYIDELNRPGSATVTCKVASLSDAVKERLVDLAATPCEVWVYVGSGVAWAGEVRTLNIQDQAVTLNCVGLLGYCSRMGITADTSFAQADQFTIARSLVGAWQGQPYGHYGIDVSSTLPSAVLRDRTYLRGDLKDVLSAITDLGAVIDGFDLTVDPATRELVLAHPQRGLDLSTATILDSRSIDSATVAQSVDPGDIASDVSATSSAQSTSGAQTSLYSYRSDTALQQSFGRTWESQSFDDITDQATLDAHADSFLAVRGGQLLQPGLTLVPNPATGTGVGDFGTATLSATSSTPALGCRPGRSGCRS